MAIRVGGVSSGFPTEDWINAIMEAEKAPLYKMQEKQQVLQWQKELLSSIKSSLFTLQSKATDLTYSTTFQVKTATSTNESALTATVQTGAGNGTYNVTVVELARSAWRLSGAITQLDNPTAAQAVGAEITANASTTLGDLGISDSMFTIGGKNITVLATDTLADAMNKINAAGAGVKTTFVETVSGNGKLTLTQGTLGSSFTVANGSGNFLSVMGIAETTYSGNVDEYKATALNDAAVFGPGFTGGYFSINNTFIQVNATDTMEQVINRINSSTAGVTAFYDTNTKKITLTAKETGQTEITLGDGADTSNFLSFVTFGTTADVKYDGRDAKMTLNGVEVTGKTNSITVNGVTFNLKQEGASSTVTVGGDIDAMVASVQAFVDQYNTVIDLINGELSEKKVTDAETDAEKQQGILNGDYQLMSLQSKLRGLTSYKNADNPADMQYLWQIGISTGAAGLSLEEVKQGHLVIDETKLREALTNSPEQVMSLFGGTNGVMTQFKNYLNAYTKYEGLMDSRIGTNGAITREINDLSDKITAFEDRLELREQTLWNQFTAMEKAVASLQNQSAWLSAWINGQESD